MPHEIWDKHGIGTNKLIKNGAFVVTDTSDILSQLDLALNSNIDVNTMDDGGTAIGTDAETNGKVGVETNTWANIGINVKTSLKKNGKLNNFEEFTLDSFYNDAFYDKCSKIYENGFNPLDNLSSNILDISNLKTSNLGLSNFGLSNFGFSNLGFSAKSPYNLKTSSLFKISSALKESSSSKNPSSFTKNQGSKRKNVSFANSIHSKKPLKDSNFSYIYDLISDITISTNELCKKTGKPISKISSDLFMLELDGFIRKVEGGYVCITEN